MGWQPHDQPIDTSSIGIEPGADQSHLAGQPSGDVANMTTGGSGPGLPENPHKGDHPLAGKYGHNEITDPTPAKPAPATGGVYTPEMAAEDKAQGERNDIEANARIGTRQADSDMMSGTERTPEDFQKTVNNTRYDMAEAGNQSSQRTVEDTDDLTARVRGDNTNTEYSDNGSGTSTPIEGTGIPGTGTSDYARGQKGVKR
jgi:hypothetical protein